MILALGGVTVTFLAGVRLWKFGLGALLGALAIPLIWANMQPYQKRRVLTFLDSDSDPLGSGYHIAQSKIALGSGGVFGKGLFQGTQSHLNFLPEKHTDFIFAMLAEELGLVGSVFMVALYFIVIFYSLMIAMRCRHQYGRLLAGGIAVTLFCYVFVNMGMVVSILPVVGVPLPMVSYGGTAMLTMMIGIGFIINVAIYREAWFGRTGLSE